jgi:hypothetical protein
MNQLSFIDPQPGVIKSVSYDQRRIIQDICRLHCPGGIELDVTWSKGRMFAGIQKPPYRFDLNPQDGANGAADFRALPFKDQTFKSIMFDPPFLAGGGGHGIMAKKFTHIKTPKQVWALYRDGVRELERVLKRYGILVVKCQDLHNGRNQYMSHCEIMNMAVEVGLYPRDIFIHVARTRPVSWNQRTQNHARKFHSYFWVFGKQKRTIGYCQDPRLKAWGADYDDASN